MSENINNNQRIFAGIEAGGTKFNCVVGRGPEEILARKNIPTTKPEETFAAVLDFFNEQAEKFGKIEALGIAAFGPIDLHKSSPTYGYITATPKPYWSNIDFVGAFKKALNIPVEFDTDVNGSALGEYHYGAAKGVDNFVYVTIGTGIGAGIYANGKPVNGLMHPELGHMLVPTDVAPGTFESVCPFHDNCLTAMAAGPALKARWKVSADTLGEDHEAWDIQANYLAMMCMNIAMTTSPELIILGGGVMSQAHLFPKVRKRFVELLGGFMVPNKPIDEYIVAPGRQGESGELGALILALQAFDSQHCL